MPYGVNPITGRPGPAPNPPRDGDKAQARLRINVEVRTGRRPRANALPCVHCGHLWIPGDRRHEYHHYKGYGANNHYAVEVACTTCHAKMDSAKKKQTKCYLGHAFTDDNIIRNANGTRKCRKCRRKYDRDRRDTAWWREYRKRRKQREAVKHG